MGLVDQIAQTYRDIGASQAAAQQRSGEIWGQTLYGLGQIASQIPQQRIQRQEAALRMKAMQQQVDATTNAQQAQARANQIWSSFPKGDDNTVDTVGLSQRFAQANVPLEQQEKFIATADKMNRVIQGAAKDKRNRRADAANVLLGHHDENNPLTWDSVHLGAAGLHDAGLMTDADQEALVKAQASGQDPEAFLKTVRGMGDDYAKPKITIVPRGGTAINDQGQTIASGQPAAMTPTEMRMAAADPTNPQHDIAAAAMPPTPPEPTVTVRTMENGKPVTKVIPRSQAVGQSFPSQPAASTGNAEQEQSNAKTVASGIIAGDTAPSILEGTRGTAQGMALMAEIKRQGGNSDQILRNWLGTKNAIRSLNSAQQIRLAETINKASASLDRVEQLNNEWAQAAPRFGIKILNHANLKAAQNGAYGPEAASIAQRLEGQIADVTGEIGQAIMGGNSPTDHGLELAGKNISGDWSQQVLADSIKQVRYNLNLAQQARNDLLGQVGSTSTQVQTPGQSKDPLGIR